MDTKLERRMDVSWSSGLVRCTAVHDNYWTAELALPFERIGLEGAPAGHSIGFNITSADWDTKEYTCLSPTSNWHDPHQFGNLVLGAPRVAVDRIDLPAVGAGSNAMRCRVRDLSGHDALYTLELRFRAGKEDVQRRARFRLPANQSAEPELQFDTTAVGWPWTCDVRILTSQGDAVFAAKRTGTVPPPISVRIRSGATFCDAAPVLVGAQFGFGRISAARTELEVTLRNKQDDLIASQRISELTGTHLAAWLPVDALPPGAYRLTVVARENARIKGQAEDWLLVGRSPFAVGATQE